MNIVVKCSINLKDYIKFVFYQMFMKKAFRNAMVVALVCFAALFIYSIIQIIIGDRQIFITYLPLIGWFGAYLIINIYLFIMIFPNYNKHRNMFNTPIIYSFEKEGIYIGDNRQVFIKKSDIQNLEFKWKKVFINLYNGKYYMVDQYGFIKGNITLLFKWLLKM